MSRADTLALVLVALIALLTFLLVLVRPRPAPTCHPELLKEPCWIGTAACPQPCDRQ